MSPQRTKLTFLSASAIALLALATGGMAMRPPEGPVRMSSVKVEDAAGYAVFDSYGEKVGSIASVDNAKGRALWLNITLDGGGQARIASFRAFLDARHREVGLVLSKDLLAARARDPLVGVAEASPTPPSA